MKEHKHLLIIIQNELKEFLQYYDYRWQSYLFLNCKVTEEADEQNIQTWLEETLELTRNAFKITFKKDIIHSKYSQSAHKEKLYHHYFYKVTIQNMPKAMQKKHFQKNNIKYQWLSLEELKKNKRIQEVNHDIVKYVEQIETE